MPSNDEIYRLISNRTVRLTISLLAEKGPLRATQLIELIGCSPGTFYDALKKMHDIIKKKDDGSYTLTDKGIELYHMIINQGAKDQKDYITKFTLSLPYLFPIPLFSKLSKLPKRILISIFGLLLVFNIFILIYSRVILILYFPLLINFDIPYDIYIVSFLSNFLFVFSISYFLLIIFGSNIDFLRYLFCFPITFLPSVIFSLTISIFNYNLGYPLEIWIGFLPLIIAASFLISLIYSQSKIKMELCYITVFIVVIVSLAILQAIITNLL